MTTPNYQLRPAKPQDITFVYKLNKTTMQDSVIKTWGEWDETFQKKFISDKFKPERYQIITHNHNDIGVVAIINQQDKIRLDEIQLLPQYQGQGIGTHIIKTLIQQAAQSNKPLHLQVLKVNTKAKKLYQNLGFNVYDQTQTHELMIYKQHP